MKITFELNTSDKTAVAEAIHLLSLSLQSENPCCTNVDRPFAKPEKPAEKVQKEPKKTEKSTKPILGSRGWSMEDLKTTAVAVLKEGNKELLKNVVDKFGVSKITAIEEKDWPEAIELLKGAE